jgi:hypothetical protein
MILRASAAKQEQRTFGQYITLYRKISGFVPGIRSRFIDRGRSRYKGEVMRFRIRPFGSRLPSWAGRGTAAQRRLIRLDPLQGGAGLVSPVGVGSFPSYSP